MAQRTLGSFNGAVTPNVNMLTVFKENELTLNPNSTLQYADMIVKKIGIRTTAGTIVEINDRDIPIVSGTFEIGSDQIDIYSLKFPSAVEANIYYLY